MSLVQEEASSPDDRWKTYAAGAARAAGKRARRARGNCILIDTKKYVLGMLNRND